MSDPYETDIPLWSERQAALLRQHAAAAQVNDASDWTHIIEDIEAVGGSERAALSSHIGTVIEHLLKLDASSASQPRAGWRETVIRSRSAIAGQRQDSPSLRQKVDAMVPRQLVRHADWSRTCWRCTASRRDCRSTRSATRLGRCSKRSFPAMIPAPDLSANPQPRRLKTRPRGPRASGSWTWTHRHEIFWSKPATYICGGMLGLAAGAWFLIYTDHALYMHVIGGILMAYDGYMLFRRPLVLRRQPVIVDFGSGFFGGFTGGAAATPGFPVAIWCSMKG